MHLQSPITQLPLPREEQSRGLHVAIISDGNGRWGVARGLPRTAGHRAGAETVRRIVEAAPRLGIGTLTLFSLSSANLKRPPAEVNGILRLLHEYLFFFFSSSRRHTRLTCDWSSDVCSSDLGVHRGVAAAVDGDAPPDHRPLTRGDA